MKRHLLAISIGLVLLAVFVYLGKPWIGIIAVLGPLFAYLLTKFGVSGRAIFTALSLNGTLPIVAVVGFLITLCLAAYAFLLS